MEGMGLSGMGILAGGFVIITYLLMMLAMIVGWIIFLIALWRGMKAHESIAADLKAVLSNRKGE